MSAVRAERHGRVARLVLDRPGEMNAISSALIEELGRELEAAAADPGVGAILIAAEGKAFCAGADLVEARRLLADPTAFCDWLRGWRRVFGGIERVERPVIAAVQGVALAGGLELALACDVVVASEAARFGDAHIRYGLVPGGGGSQRLPDAVGSRWARWLMYTGEMIDAERALALGLAQRVLPADGFADAALALATGIAGRSAPALAFMKRMSRPRLSDDALDLEVEAAVGVITGPDAREGIAAFVDKREPRFPSVG